MSSRPTVDANAAVCLGEFSKGGEGEVSRDGDGGKGGRLSFEGCVGCRAWSKGVSSGAGGEGTTSGFIASGVGGGGATSGFIALDGTGLAAGGGRGMALSNSAAGSLAATGGCVNDAVGLAAGGGCGVATALAGGGAGGQGAVSFPVQPSMSTH